MSTYTWCGKQSLLWFRHAKSEEMLFAESQVERETDYAEREREREEKEKGEREKKRERSKL